MGVESVLPPVSVKVIVSCLLWYSVSSITSQLTKVILIKFTYPLFLSQCQFLIGASFALAFITIVRRFPEVASHFPKGSVPIDTTSAVFNVPILLKILPLGLFQFCGKYFSLSATSLIPLATVSSVKALSPLLIVTGYRVIYKVRFSLVTYLCLTPLVGGVILIIASDSLYGPFSIVSDENNEIDYDRLKGLVFCLISTVIFASQNIYGKQLMTWDSNLATDPTSLVLNTETDSDSDYGVANSKPIQKSPHAPYLAVHKKTPIRNRVNSIRLPFSSSDLSINEMNEEIKLQPNLYNEQVQQNSTIYNPFGYITEKFELEKISKPDKLTIILYCSMIGFVFSLSGFLVNELPRILKGQYQVQTVASEPSEVIEYHDLITILALILLDSLSHFAQTILAFHLLGSMPALTYSIASMMKRIVLIAVSIILAIGTIPPKEHAHKWFGKITNQQLLGLVSIAIGLYCYDRWGSRTLAGR